MTNLRVQLEEHLATSLEDVELFGLPVQVIGPDGVVEDYFGQVNYRSQDDEGIMVNVPSVVLRLSSLSYVPTYGDKCVVRIPATPDPDADLVSYAVNSPPKRNDSLGIITIRLTKLEQAS